MDQKKIFLKSEGDNWFLRNKKKPNYSNEPVILELKKIFQSKKFDKKKINLLEIGCSDGSKLKYIKKKFKCNVFGVEPSKKATLRGLKDKIYIENTTADKTSFKNQYFDIVIFGFFLYLTDRKFLNKIFNETDRILKKKGWLIIHDFYSQYPKKIPYRHDKRIYSYKDDYSKIFLRKKSNYMEYSKRIFDFYTKQYSVLKKNWEIISVIKKF